MRRISPAPVPYLTPGPANIAALSTPQWRMTFYTAGNGIFSATQGENPAIDLMAATWQKQRASSSQPGTWSATFTLRQGSDGESWMTRLNPQDGVLIEARGDIHDPWTSLCVGWVSSVAPSTQPQGSSSVATVTVSGADMCKPLTKPQPDFYAAVNTPPLQNQYAVATSSVQALAEPVLGSVVVETLPPGVQVPVVTTAPGWVQVDLPEGDAWVPSAQVQISSKPNAYAAQLTQIVQAYAVAANVGSGSVQGLTELLLNMAASNTADPFTGTGDPPSLIAATLLLWTFKTQSVPWNIGSKTVGLPDILRFALEQPSYGISITTAALSPYQGPVWQFFTSFANEPLFELFLDTRSNAEIDSGALVNLAKLSQTSDDYDAVDGATVPNGVLFGEDEAKAVLVYRRPPFDPDDWARLVSHTISPLETCQRQVSKSDDDVVNIYFGYPDIQVSQSQAFATTFVPLLDAASGVRYGLNTLRVPVQGLTSGDMTTAFAQIDQDLFNWYSPNPTFWAGTLTLYRGRPEIKVGQVVVDGATGLSYYVEAVQHQWVAKGSMTTQLQVSRGAYRGPALP